jgi:hypothetical protein
MSSKFLTAMAAAGIIALGMSGTYAEDKPVSPDNPSSGKPGDNNGKEPKRLNEERKRPELREGREFERERIVEFALKKKYPQEVEEINKIRKDDPEKAKAQMQSLKKKIWEEQKAEKEKIRNMIAEYKNNQDPKQLDAIKAKITERLNEQLEMEKKIIAQSEEKVKEMQERLAKFKAEYQKRLENKNQMIENKIKELSKNPEMFY